MGDKFGSIVFYSFYIFERNYHKLKSTIQGYKNLIASDDFISDSQKYMELHIYGGRELSRLIHNYATAWSSLRDSTRAIQRKLETKTKFYVVCSMLAPTNAIALS
ncbi:hypothetical protein H6G54_09735 [Anabaena cylindrica FACHB-243]|uniref:Uncharacterized protein n=1 Tax=Anabaena cylindrica (strain ATCC 27899 / PCC 7122) TaxID=272123 RepID=K9ZL88_ANACC|nr:MULTISPECIES: hypothetical protein [Anabaena]AFZ59956.1 hypothetical protein Anacy_4605 [Anabaena cylindrica PCC 7122]MBD2417985.1 hypothetical protein [Anabaena cylindrica FACHB-243]MBY5282669.1 hypothetical protein [Anabaena sp. CCAP 1446/1C]MBY5307545.1 hypothetical protein [Anabaena sp. CCAP 1446/1C]MCM2404902.1 hypothetical protein [Anabaena sp. CCAP 1446/1C]